MRGVSQLAALSILLVGAWSAARADVTASAGVRAVAREKAAAIDLLRHKTSDVLSTVAQDRLFAAYLNATTQGEGARVRTRIEHALATFIRRFGFNAFQLIDRSGAVVTYVSTTTTPVSLAVDVRRDRLLASGFVQETPGAVSVVVRKPNSSNWTMSLVAPVRWHGQTEYVLRAEQDGGAYRRVLGLGLRGKRYAVLTDERGQVLSDTRSNPPAGALTVAGQTLPALRRSLGGHADDGSGSVSLHEEKFNVSYRKSGDWTVVVVEPVLPPRRCTKDGERLCG
jgi:hypothetical protein